jgi:hypothetical protein
MMMMMFIGTETLVTQIPDALAGREGGIIALVGGLGRPETPSTEHRMTMFGHDQAAPPPVKEDLPTVESRAGTTHTYVS